MRAHVVARGSDSRIIRGTEDLILPALLGRAGFGRGDQQQPVCPVGLHGRIVHVIRSFCQHRLFVVLKTDYRRSERSLTVLADGAGESSMR
jgi:hypothetical protein